jgi:adenylate kinase
MSRGELVPDEVTIGMLLERIAKPDAEPGFMLDGFPRTIAQAEALDVALAERGGAIDVVLYIEAPEDELIARLSGRWTCPDCGAIYHEQAHPPNHAGHCDDCGAGLVQREDDRPQTVRQRLDVNREWTAALVGFYERAGKLHTVDGCGAPSAVTERLLSVLDGVSVSVRKA